MQKRPVTFEMYEETLRKVIHVKSIGGFGSFAATIKASIEIAEQILQARAAGDIITLTNNKGQSRSLVIDISNTQD